MKPSALESGARTFAADEMLYERGTLETGSLPFEQLKESARINEPARAAPECWQSIIRVNASHFMGLKR